MKILHLDIETSPNLGDVWQLWNTTVALSQLRKTSSMICWAAKWHGSKEIFFRSVFHDSKKKMLKEIHRLLCEADVVVHYNGKKFDIPTLNKEFIQNTEYGPPTPFHQVDIYKVIKKDFKFASYKFEHIANELGIGQKIKHEGHNLWVKCGEGDANAWERMKKYNIGDVKLLEKAYNRFLPWIKTHPNHAFYTDTNRPICTNCGDHRVIKNGVEYTSTLSYQRYMCSSCGAPLRGKYTIMNETKKKNLLVRSKL